MSTDADAHQTNAVVGDLCSDLDEPDYDIYPLRCWECNLNFTSRDFLHSHLYHHIKQPVVVLERLPPLKITLKQSAGNFEIVSNSSSSPTYSLHEEDLHKALNLEPDSDSINTTEAIPLEAPSDYGGIPGAEPTPPPEPSPDYPKIRIKTTGLMEEQPLTITEITDENPSGEPSQDTNQSAMSWPTPSLEDPLKLPDTSDETNIMSLFNNNDKAKDYGFCSTESEYISLERLEERNRGAMQLYNPNSQLVPSRQQQQQNPLDQLTGLPMQALAQQVSRLQPAQNGMHQQNVLINIQQFPTGMAPQPPAYQPPPMYPPHHQPPMYPPYQYQHQTPLYYPPAPGYPPQPHLAPPHPQMHPPPPPQQPLSQPAPGQVHPGAPPQQQQSQVAPQTYRQPLPPRQAAPRQQTAQRMMGPRSMTRPGGGMRQRIGMGIMRGVVPGQARGMRPRMAPQNGSSRMPAPINKRVNDTMNNGNSNQMKKKRLDLLTPDRDDEDCQVICTQPKNTDGGLPQIESVQGGQSEPAENSIMHLSDSITLSVRNPPPKPVEKPTKSDASAVANILATRGITVTPTAKQNKDKEQPKTPTLPSALNLNGVSIVPAASKTNGAPKAPDLPTVDLTDDIPKPNSMQKRPGLPYRCELCTAQYPTSTGLNKHRQSFHKTTSGLSELGIPLINLKQPGIIQRLASIGVQNYIPLPSASGDGLFAFPVISTRNPGNMAALGATQMLNLGPVRNIPRPQPQQQQQRPAPKT